MCSSKPWKVDHEPGQQSFCCYRYVSKPRKSFNGAEAQCQVYGRNSGLANAQGHLASVRSERVNKILVELRRATIKRKRGMDAKSTGWDQVGKTESSWIGGKVERPYNDSKVAWNRDAPADTPTWMHRDTGEYENWYGNSPSEYDRRSGRKECVSLGLDQKHAEAGHDEGKWSNSKCGLKKGYFCQICVEATTTTTTEAPSTTTTLAPSTTTTTAPTTTSTIVPTTTTTVAPSTTTTEAKTTTTTATTAGPTTTTTTAAPSCAELYPCASDCGWPLLPFPEQSACGWSTKHGRCVEGGKTSAREAAARLGECAGTTTLPATTMLPERYCKSIQCSDNCNGLAPGSSQNCGWSTKHRYCKLGGHTHETKEKKKGNCPP